MPTLLPSISAPRQVAAQGLWRISALLGLILAGVPAQIQAQNLQSKDPAEIEKQFAANPPFFLQVASKAAKWNEPAEPMKVAGPIYFIGTEGLSAWLITSSAGLIVMNTGMPESGPLMVASIKKLGFNPADIKLLLTCHAHIDHAGALAYLKRISGAQVVIMDREKELLESGGRADFHYAAYPQFAYEPVKADRTIQDGETVMLGDVTLTARLTPGHSKGGTTWTMRITEDGREYSVVFPDGSSLNPGYRVAVNPSYPGINTDYRHTFQILEALKPDIWLAPHAVFMDVDGKRARAAQEGYHAWVDPEGYAKFIASQRALFDAREKAEKAASPTGR